MAPSRFSAFVSLPSFEMLEPRVLLSNTAPVIGGIPNITIDENTSYPAIASGVSSSPVVGVTTTGGVAPIGFDGDTSQFMFAGTPGSPLGDATPQGVSFLNYQQFGGTWWDAEKTLSNTQDELMCWAAAASNALEWSGWGSVLGMTTSQQIFQYFQDHWTDQGGLMSYGWDWWFNGANPSQGWSGWSQVDVAGGAFDADKNPASYIQTQYNSGQAMSAVDQYTRAGDAVTLGLYGPGGHAITCWGFNYDPNNPTNYYGVWVTDSDDDKNTDSPTAALRYYQVALSGGKWYLQNYYGSNSWYIGAVEAIGRAPAQPPPVDNGIDLWKYASDAETPSGQLTYSLVGNTDGNDVVALVSNRWIQFHPTHNWFGSSQVTVQVSDGQYTASETFTFTATHVNQAPTISGVPDEVLTTNHALPNAIFLPNFAADAETPAGSLSYSIVGNTNPNAGVTLVNGNTISINPAFNWTGFSDVTVQVSDGQLTSTDTFRVTVTSDALAGTLTPLIMANPTKGFDYHLVELTVTNTTGALINGWSTMDLYASADGVIDSDGNDFKLSEIRPYVYLPSGSTGYYFFSYLAPSNIPAGTYDLVAKLDANGELSGLNGPDGSNHLAVLPGRVVVQDPDLTASLPWVYMPTAPNKGAYGVALIQVTNASSVFAVAPMDIQVWATTDGNVHDGVGDTLLTTLHNYWVVAPGSASNYFVAVFQLPTSMADGNYKLDVVINSAGTIAETNMANNEVLSAQTFAIGSSAQAALAQAAPAAETPVKAAPARAWTAPVAAASTTTRKVVAVVAADEDVAVTTAVEPAPVVVAPAHTTGVVAATSAEDDLALAVAEPVGAATYEYGHSNAHGANLSFDTKWWDDLMAM